MHYWLLMHYRLPHNTVVCRYEFKCKIRKCFVKTRVNKNASLETILAHCDLLICFATRFKNSWLIEKFMIEKSGVEKSGLRSLGLKSPGLESSWLKSPGLKGLGLKLGVEKSGVEMSFNLSRRLLLNLF